MDRNVTGGQVQIAAPGITLDCANHSIGGDRYGVSVVGVTDVTVQNCVINPSQLTGCRGIDSSGHRHRFLHNTFPGPAGTTNLCNAIYSSEGTDIEVSNNTVQNAHMSGVAGHAILMWNCRNCRVLNNTVTGRNAQVYLAGGDNSGAEFANNVVTSVNRVFGLSIGTSLVSPTFTTDVHVHHNTMTNARMNLIGAHSYYIHDNTISNAEISVQGETVPLVEDAVALIENNVIRQDAMLQGQHGIFVSSSNASNTAAFVTIRNNTLNGGTGVGGDLTGSVGIYLQSTAGLIENNQVTGHRWGIMLERVGHVIVAGNTLVRPANCPTCWGLRLSDALAALERGIDLRGNLVDGFGVGIYVNGGGGIEFQENEVRSASEHGLRFLGLRDSTFIDNRFFDVGTGLEMGIATADANNLFANNVFERGTKGMLVTGSFAANNRFLCNTVRDFTGYGIDASCRQVLFRGNVVVGNCQGGDAACVDIYDHGTQNIFESSVCGTAIGNTCLASLPANLCPVDPEGNPACVDRDLDGFTQCDGDCNDQDPAVYPGAPESCNGVDDNCDGAVDNGIPAVATVCGVGACASTGSLVCVDHVLLDTCVPGTPVPEACNRRDDDCNGTADDGIDCAPLVDAGTDQTVRGASLVLLSGEAIPVFSGDTLLYGWEQVSGDLTVELVDGNTLNPRFTVPNPPQSTTLTFRLTVTDPDGRSASDTVNVTVERDAAITIVNDLSFKVTILTANLGGIVDGEVAAGQTRTLVLPPDQYVVISAYADWARFAVNADGLVTYDESFESVLDGRLTDTLIIHGLTIQVLSHLTYMGDGSLASHTDASPLPILREVTTTFQVLPAASPGSVPYAYWPNQGGGSVGRVLFRVTALASGEALITVDPTVHPGVYVVDGSFLELNGLPLTVENGTDKTPMLLDQYVALDPVVASFALTEYRVISTTSLRMVQYPYEGVLGAIDGEGLLQGLPPTFAGEALSGNGTSVLMLQSPCTDVDADGYGAAGTPNQGCVHAGYEDCDDRDATVYPGAVERCNLADDDCDGMIDDEIDCTPEVDAGADQSVCGFAVVMLAAEAHSVFADRVLTYAWEQIAGVPLVALTGGDTLTPTFVAPNPPDAVTLTFRFTATDSEGLIALDNVEVTVKRTNLAPSAQAGQNQAVLEGVSVVLDGTASFDEDNDALTYLWEQVVGPDDPLVTLSGADTAAPSFEAPYLDVFGQALSIRLTFRLTITDQPTHTFCGTALSSTAEVVVVVENVNHDPVADAGSAQTVNENGLVTLQGSGSDPADHDPVSFSWEQVEGPVVTLIGADTATPSFTAPSLAQHEQATLVFVLTVADGYGGSAQSTTRVTVLDFNAPPHCEGALPTVATIWPPNHKFVTVAVGNVTDPEDPVTVVVTAVYQDEPTNGLGDGDTPTDAVIQDHGAVLLRAERSGKGDGRVYHVFFEADDGFGGTCSGAVRVCVPHDVKRGCTDGGALFDATRP